MRNFDPLKTYGGYTYPTTLDANQARQKDQNIAYGRAAYAATNPHSVWDVNPKAIEALCYIGCCISLIVTIGGGVAGAVSKNKIVAGISLGLLCLAICVCLILRHKTKQSSQHTTPAETPLLSDNQKATFFQQSDGSQREEGRQDREQPHESQPDEEAAPKAGEDEAAAFEQNFQHLPAALV